MLRKCCLTTFSLLPNFQYISNYSINVTLLPWLWACDVAAFLKPMIFVWMRNADIRSDKVNHV